MSWVKEKGGHYCDRCGAAIWMGVRQERFINNNPRIGAKAGDPYLSVHRVAFFEPDKPLYSGFMYCFDCEPVVMSVLEALNKKGEPHGKTETEANEQGKKEEGHRGD